MSNDINNVSATTMAGGALRVTFGAPTQETQPQPMGPTTRVNGGVTRWTAGQGAETSEKVTRHTVSFDGVEGGSVLATIARAGTGQTVELIPGRPETRTLVEVAIREGVLKRGPGGVLMDVRTASGEQATLTTQEQEQEQRAEANESQKGPDTSGIFDKTEDDAFAQEVADIPESAFTSTMAAAVKAMTFGDDDTSAINRLATSTGLDPAAAAEKVENVKWYFQNHADRAIAKVGVSEDQREAFYDSLRQNPGKLHEAIQFLVHGRDPSRFQEAASDWLAKQGRHAAHRQGGQPAQTSTPNAAMFEAAGFKTSVARDGTLMVSSGGGRWVPAADVMGR